VQAIWRWLCDQDLGAAVGKGTLRHALQARMNLASGRSDLDQRKGTAARRAVAEGIAVVAVPSTCRPHQVRASWMLFVPKDPIS